MSKGSTTPFCVPNLSGLPAPQKILLPELIHTPPHFILCGGTAIALRLGHRISVDFDFFSKESFDPDHLYHQIPYLKASEILQKDHNTLTCLVERNGPIKISFFGGLSLQYIDKPDILEGPEIKIATLVDLAGMKAAVVQKRAAAKDYIDLDALIVQKDISLATALAAGVLIYGKQFNPQITLKALTYFHEGDLETLSQNLKNRLTRAVQAVDVERILEQTIILQQRKGISS